MSMAWVRKNYNVPAYRGCRVVYTGEGRREFGTIKSAKGSQLSILLDDHKIPLWFHPTWKMEYMT